MMKLWNYGRNSKLISEHMIRINELMIMVALTHVMKVMIIKMNKWIAKTITLLETNVAIETIIKRTINIFYNNDDNNNNSNNSN